MGGIALLVLVVMAALLIGAVGFGLWKNGR